MITLYALGLILAQIGGIFMAPLGVLASYVLLFIEIILVFVGGLFS